MIVLIGKLMDEANGYLQVAYPSMTGVAEARIPQRAVARREQITNGRVALLVRSTREFDSESQFSGRNSPYHVTDEHLRIVDAFENEEPIDLDDYDDEVPMMDVDDAPTITIVGDNGEAPTASDDQVWGQGLFAGGRRDNACDWRFTPTRRRAFVFLEEDEQHGMAPTAASVNNAAGAPCSYHIFNPNYASEKRPMGAHLGVFGKDYYPLPYERGFEPILQYAEENGWKASVTAYGEGKVARLDCDVSQAGHTKDATAIRMGSLARNFDESFSNDIINGLSDLYRYGFTVYNSLDGSSAFKIEATAMRAKCSNMAMFSTSRSNVLSMKHTSSLEFFDFESLGEKINEVILACQRELVSMELLKHVPTTSELLERIMTLSERKGLITKPQIVRNDDGVVTSLNRGYMWKVLGLGMTHPSESWVNVTNKEKGSLYHVYNVLTGALTHKPIYNEPGKKALKGSTLNFGTLDRRLKTTHSMLMEIGGKAIKTYFGESGEITEDKLEDMKARVNDMGLLDDVPMFSEVLY